MTRDQIIEYVRYQCSLLGEPITNWTDSEVFNLGVKNWELDWNGK